MPVWSTWPACGKKEGTTCKNVKLQAVKERQAGLERVNQINTWYQTNQRQPNQPNQSHQPHQPHQPHQEKQTTEPNQSNHGSTTTTGQVKPAHNRARYVPGTRHTMYQVYVTASYCCTYIYARRVGPTSTDGGTMAQLENATAVRA